MSPMKFWDKTMWEMYDKRAKSKGGTGDRYQIDEIIYKKGVKVL